MSILRTRQQTARQTKDMFAWQRTHLAMLCLAIASFRRFTGGPLRCAGGRMGPIH